MHRLFIGVASLAASAGLMLSVASARADDPDPHMPAPGYCPGAEVPQGPLMSHCDGVKFPDGSYWRDNRYLMPSFGFPENHPAAPGLRCVVDTAEEHGLMAKLAPAGGCGGAV